MLQHLIPVVADDYPELIRVWESSVRETHDFLTEQDIQEYKPLILEQYFEELQLFCIKQDETIAGFMGLDGFIMQMLFVDPEFRGTGIGKTLVTYAIDNFGTNAVDVNEQNQQAVGFYEYMGFEVKERFEEDAAGKPYPILSMTLKEEMDSNYPSS